MGFYHTGCMNFHDAYKLLVGEEGHHSLALLDRYITMPLLPENPYADPPSGFKAPKEAMHEGSLLRDRNGLWRRDKVPSPQEVVIEGMKRVKAYVEDKVRICSPSAYRF